MGQVQYPFDLGAAAANPSLAQAGIDYEAGKMGLDYQQQLAQHLLQQSAAPYSSGVGAHGMAYRVSPLEGLAHVLSGGLGAYQMQQNVEQAKELARQYGTALIGGVSQIPGSGGSANTLPNGGMVPGNNTNSAPTSAADISTRLETGQTNPLAAIANISRDTGGSKSYGNFGLNSLKGNSAWQFRNEYGGQLGITADPGTQAFDQQWLTAAQNNPQALRAAELDWYSKNVAQPTAANLEKIGLPADKAQDPRVQAYFSDRAVQQGPYSTINHSSRIMQAYNQSGGDTAAFLRNMTQSDMQPAHWQSDFGSAIRSGVYGERGNVARVTGRLEGALGLPAQSITVPTAQSQSYENQVYYIPHVSQQTAYTLWMSDPTRKAWSNALDTSLRTYGPTPEQKNVEASGATPQQGRSTLALAAGKNAGVPEGMQLVQGPNGIEFQPIPGYTEEKARAAGVQEYAKGQAGNYVKKQEHIEANASTAQAELPQLQLLSKVIQDKNFYSGWAADNVEKVSSAARSLGLSEGQGASLMQFAKKLGSAGSLENIQEMAQYGAVRVPEMHMIEKSNMDINNTPQANAAVVEIRSRLAQRHIDIADMANAYANQHNGQIDRGFDQLVRDYYKNRPLFSAKEVEDYNTLLSGKAAAPAKPSLSPAPATTHSAADVEAEMRRRGLLK